MEYNDYINELNKIKKDSINGLNKDWKVLESVYLKVNENGEYKKFIGNTVVIPLNNEDKKKVQIIQKLLYSELNGILANELPEETFHLTIHDLCNYFTADNLEKCMKNSENKVKEVFRELKEIYENTTITLNSNGLFNGGAAIGIQFYPKDFPDFNALINMYNIFEKVLPLKKILIPHVTLGYYLPKEYTYDEIQTIKKVLNDIEFSFEITLSLNALTFQRFENMIKYIDLFSLKDI
ncbi:hypothetical protein Marpi_2095 [Marinitoga piezophila KA3]|uniref:DUF1868 domain-containing protein n=1 Tax=Marinitoga piezophila (strain DSM 14283 / JCM 11233 / KA3) TaxID=443254 RepID=H2J7H7_MARPK|nr:MULTISPECIES: hypothetical protein [Marinitoga]AEX86470.1 hypothetical protein Marpi_2095 [Marinitoga piezophila KA3]